MRISRLNRPALSWLMALMGMAPIAVCNASTQDTSASGEAARYSELMPLAASRGLMLDVVAAKSRAVAVGDRGQVLVSEDRQHWQQIADVPTRATLTAVTAVHDRVWAVGHDGTIIASQDGGLTWTLQRQDIWDPSPGNTFDPRQGVPLLDILMIDQQHGFAVGAYAQLLRTDDGGTHWQFVPTGDGHDSAATEDQYADAEETEAGNEADSDDSWSLSESDLAMDDLEEPHFNAIAQTSSGALMIVGERGAGFRSRDGGQTWERVELPYHGSMFGLIGFENERVVAFGMRGNVFESHDLGQTWESIPSGTDLSLMGGAARADGGFVLVGANGIVISREPATSEVRRQIYANAEEETPVLSSVLLSADGMIVAGEKGVDQFTSRKKN